MGALCMSFCSFLDVKMVGGLVIYIVFWYLHAGWNPIPELINLCVVNKM